MELPLYQVDAFTDRLFGGNPAGVCPLDRWLPDGTMQAIAAENNVAETAFFRREGDAYRLRWFTPTVEVELCGHATLASAYVISSFLEPGCKGMAFRQPQRAAHGDADRRFLRPRFPFAPAGADREPGDRPGLGPRTARLACFHAVPGRLRQRRRVAALAPDMAALTALDRDGVIATAPGKDSVDYVARFFAPQAGIPEDPATGMAQCTLVPYWAGRLGKKQLTGRQISRRIGDFACELAGDRVKIGGKAVCYFKGSITLDA